MDADGAVAVAKDHVADVVEAAQHRNRNEAAMRERLAADEPTLWIFWDFDHDPDDRHRVRTAGSPRRWRQPRDRHGPSRRRSCPHRVPPRFRLDEGGLRRPRLPPRLRRAPLPRLRAPGCGESSCEDPVQALDPVPCGRRQGGPARSGDRALPPRGPFHGRPHRAHARPPGPGSRPELRRHRGQRRPRGNASSADRSSRTRHTTPRASSTPSSNGRAIRRSSPVRSTRRASGTRSAPAPYAASSSPSSTSPTTAT